MRTLRRPTVSRALRYGALAAAGGAVWTLTEYALGWHTTHAAVGRWTGFVSLVFPVAAIVWALRAARREAGGALSFRRGLGEAAGVGAVLASLGGAFFYAYHAWLHPAFGPAARAGTPATQAAAAAVSSLGVGLLVGVVAAAAMRARAPEAAPEAAPEVPGTELAPRVGAGW
jgi:hypothetical protein